MSKVTFGKRIADQHNSSTTPFFFDGIEAGYICAHTQTDGTASTQSGDRYLVHMYEVVFYGEFSDLGEKTFKVENYETGARGALAAARRWVKENAAELATFGAPLKAGEPLPVLKLRSWADPAPAPVEAPAPAPAPAPVEAPAPAPVQEKKRARRKTRPNLTDYKNLARRALGVRDVDSFSYEVITIDIDPLTGQGVNYLDHFEGRSLRSVPVGVPCYLKLWEDEGSLFDDLRFMIDPESGEALLIEFGKNGTGERARSLLRTMGHTWAPAPAPLPMAAEIDSEALGPVTYDDVAGLLCCAFEWGAYHWARLKVCYDPSLEEMQKPAFGNWKGFRAYMINHPEWVVEVRALEGPTKIIKLPDLLKGLRIMRRDYPHHWADFMSGNSDATTGDVFLQCAMFGEVVYG